LEFGELARRYRVIACQKKITLPGSTTLRKIHVLDIKMEI
jgi:hypothetical protein